MVLGTMNRRDLVAGLSVAGLMLPEAVAYASIAGLPADRAIVAAIAGAGAYALFGRSRFAIISPTSSSAAILAAALGTMTGDPALKLLMATLATLLVAITFIGAGVFKLGGLTSFVSRPVLRGFAFGLAITIIIKQLPVLVNVPAAGPSWEILRTILGDIAHWNWLGMAVGATALCVLLLLRRFPGVPAAFLVLVGGICVSALGNLSAHGVGLVGTIRLVPQWPHWIPLRIEDISRLAELALPLFLILLAESWGTMRTLALRHGDSIDADRELRALGWSNLAAAIVQGMPVGAGFSAGSASEAAGARTRATGAIAAAGLLILILLGSSAVALLPSAVLAAVVIAALAHALDPAPFVRLWRLKRDFVVACGAAAGVLVFGVLNGMLLAILLSLALLIRRLSSPEMMRLGRLGKHDFVDVARHPEAELPAKVMIWRPAEPLFFANAERVFAAIDAHQQSEPSISSVVVSLEQSFDLDSSSLDALLEFDRRLTARGVTLRLARTRDVIRDLLAAANARGLADRCSFSVDDAVSLTE